MKYSHVAAARVGSVRAMTISTGTLILAVRTERGIYLASDSRSTNPRLDTAQKIFKCGHVAFVALCGTVIARIASPLPHGEESVATLNLMTMLDEISNEYPGNCDVVEYTKRRTYATLDSFWKVYVEPSPEVFLASQPANGVLCTIQVICWRGIDEVHEIRFPYSPSGQLLDPVSMDRSEQVVGWGNIPDDAAEISTHTGSRASVLAYIDTMYARAACLYSESVGGDTDVGFVDGYGARWIRRKAAFHKDPIHHEKPPALGH